MKKPMILAAATATGVALVWTFGPTLRLEADSGAGQAIYAANCAECHGASLQGEPNWRRPNQDGTYPAPPHDESGHTWHHDDAYLFAYTKFGGAAVLAQMGITNVPSAMPGFADSLSDDDIKAVLAYIESTWPERIREARKARLSGG
jgi:mono/diheme cytochrome c family protein